MREQRVRLENRVHIPLVGRQVRHVCAADSDLAFVRALEARNQPERRRLAAARRPEQGQELAVPDSEVETVDGGDLVETLGHTAQFDV